MTAFDRLTDRIFGADTLDDEDRRAAAQVHFSTRLPTLTLEDIDHHLEYISCSPASILLGFVTTSVKQAALEEFQNTGAFYLITSHEVCNNDGERNVYR